MQLAKISKRIAGGIVDITIITILTALAVFAYVNANSTYFLNASYEMKELAIKVTTIEFAIAIDLLYTIGMQISAQQATYGQRLFKIRIANEKGGKANLIQILVRYFVSWISSLMLKIGYLFALSPGKRTLHDLIAKTIVIENIEKQPNIKNDEDKNLLKNKIMWVAISTFLIFSSIIFFYKYKVNDKEKTFEFESCTRCNSDGCKPEIRLTKFKVTLSNIETYYILEGVENKTIHPSKNSEKCEILKNKNFAFMCNSVDHTEDKFFNNTYTTSTIFDGNKQYQETSTTESNFKKWTSSVACIVK